ncbi:hypothetical protein RP20_CCG017226 [Aedes albopictus]|nr:hypothetical protein RP20_CCG017226 [Aedes albopictus]
MALNPETNPANLCRVCIRDVTDAPSQNIFECCDSDRVSIYDKLGAVCAQIFTEDKSPVCALPLRVCLDCKSKIDEAYELHKMCLESHRLLRELLTAPTSLAEVTIKEEPLEVYENEPALEEETKVFAERLDIPKAKDKADELGKFQCEKCETKTKQMFALYKHMKHKHRNEVLPCDKCYEAFFDEAKLEEHRKIHDHVKPYKCPNCPKRFKVRRVVTLHENQCKGHKPYLCTECGKAYSYSSSLAQHVARHRERSFVCDRCPSKFHTKGALKVHLMSSHATGKNVSCETCGARFATKYMLQRHMISHSDERPYACEVCNMRFKKVQNMRRHMRTHTGEKPHQCTHCDRAFSQSNDLIKHIKTHVGDKPYKCEQCDATFRLCGELRIHREVHYRKQPQQQQDGDQDETEVTSGLANDSE